MLQSRVISEASFIFVSVREFMLIVISSGLYMPRCFHLRQRLKGDFFWVS